MNDFPTAIVVLVMITGPGATATAALFPPGTQTLPGRIALSFGLGISIIATATFSLAVLSILSLISLLVTLLAVTVAMAAVAFRRSSPRARLGAACTEFRTRPLQLLTGLAVLAAIGIARARLSSLTAVLSDAPLRYWADGLDIASAGTIPEHSLQWGAIYPPSAMKMLLNSFSGGVNLVVGSEALPAIGALMWVSSVALAATFWWLGTAFGLERTAPLLPLALSANSVLFGGEEITADLQSYRAENLGRVVAFGALALTLQALRAGDGRYIAYAVSGALFGVSSLFHLVPTMIALAFLGFYSGFYLVSDAVKRVRGRWLLDSQLRTLVARLGMSGVVALLFATSVIIAGGGDLALQGAEGRSAYLLGEDEPDPTLLFVKGRRVPLGEAQERAWYHAPTNLVHSYLRAALGMDFEQPWLWLGVGFLGAVLIIILASARLKPTAVAALGILVTILATTLAFSYIYTVFAQASFGPRRLFDYASMPFYLLLLVFVECVWTYLDRFRAWLSRAGAIGLVVVAAIVLLPSLHPREIAIETGMKTVRDLEWIRLNLPCGARLVTNRRTNATYQVLTGRVSVIEGMGPHLRPEMLGRIIDLLERNREFFLDPETQSQYLEAEGADYVVFFRNRPRRPNLRSLAGKSALMDRAPFLRLLHEGERANIYEVLGTDGRGSFPNPADFPGFRCRRSLIEM